MAKNHSDPSNPVLFKVAGERARKRWRRSIAKYRSVNLSDEPYDDGFLDDDEREEYERRWDDEATDAWDEERVRG